jgi:hypothetical protein
VGAALFVLFVLVLVLDTPPALTLWSAREKKIEEEMFDA